MRSDARHVGHVEVKEKKKKKKKKKKKTKAIWPCGKLKQTESHFDCEFQSEQKTQKIESFSLRGAVRKDREKHNESVRE